MRNETTCKTILFEKRVDSYDILFQKHNSPQLIDTSTCDIPKKVGFISVCFDTVYM